VKYLLILLMAGCGFCVHAQNVFVFLVSQHTAYGNLNFISHANDLEDHWAAFPKNNQNRFPFGYVYMDAREGFTIHMEGSFQLDDKGHAFRDLADLPKIAQVKILFAPNTQLIAAIPDSMLADLNVNPVPEWLAAYKRDLPEKGSVAMQVLKGKHINSLGAPKKALEYLESAYKTEPHATGLEFELTYAYNELQQYTKAIKVLNAAIAYAPDSAIFYRELGYAYMKGNNADSAVRVYIKGISIAKINNKPAEVEMADNLANVYSLQLHQYDKAIATLKAVINDVPDNVTLYMQMAGVYLTANDFDSAIKAYTTAIDITPQKQVEQKAQLAFMIALAYRNQKKDKENYTIWVEKAKAWAPANSRIAQMLNNLTF
jgi:tetratricopeptide (TPR) repeat protein